MNLLGAMLGQAVRERWGEGAFELVDELRRLCKQAETEGDPALREAAARRAAALGLEEIVVLLRAYTTFFHLVNQAEKQEIVHINRERGRSGIRPESLAATVDALHAAGVPLAGVLAQIELLARWQSASAAGAPPEALRRALFLSINGIAAGMQSTG